MFIAKKKDQLLVKLTEIQLTFMGQFYDCPTFLNCVSYIYES